MDITLLLHLFLLLSSQRAASLPPASERPADVRRGELRLPVRRVRPGGLRATLSVGGGPRRGRPLPGWAPHLEGPAASGGGGASAETLVPLRAVRRVQRPEHLHCGGRDGRDKESGDE